MRWTIMTLYEDCCALEDDFDRCSDATVARIKSSLMEHLCDPRNRSVTTVSLPKPMRMNGSVVVRAIFQRCDARIVLTTVVDPESAVHVFPFSDTDQDVL